jgi:hypothetical protein
LFFPFLLHNFLKPKIFEKSIEKFSAAVAKSGKFLSRRRRWVKKNLSFRAAAAEARKFLSRRRRRTKK